MLTSSSTLFIKSFSNIFKTSKRFLEMGSYVWIDMEVTFVFDRPCFHDIHATDMLTVTMTGLDPTKHTVLEIACIITNPQLKIVHEGIHLIIHQSEEILASMNEWSLKQHAQTGLTEASRKSNITLPQADEQVAKYIEHHCKGDRYLAGNSVYMDRIFIMKYFPKTDSLLHYRILDVSSIKILCSNWYPEIFSKLNKKKLVHRALDDIKESVEELQIYREKIFK